MARILKKYVISGYRHQFTCTLIDPRTANILHNWQKHPEEPTKNNLVVPSINGMQLTEAQMQHVKYLFNDEDHNA